MMIKRILLFSVCLLMIGCGKSTKVSDLQYKGRGWDIFVYLDGEPFDGVAWSDDGESYKITADCGIVKKVEYFDEDGKLFCLVEDKEKTFFNEKGNEITRSQARELYPEKFDRWKFEQQGEMEKLVKSHTTE